MSSPKSQAVEPQRPVSPSRRKRVIAEDNDRAKTNLLNNKTGDLPKTSKAGRNLPAATAVGLGLLSVVGICLFYLPTVFVVIVCLAVCLAIDELRRSLYMNNHRMAIIPVQVGAVGILVSAYYLGLEAMFAAALLSLAICVLWLSLGDRLGAQMLKDMTICAFVLGYVPLMAGFALLIYHDYGPWLTCLFIIAPVASDTGGYALGVLVGKHPIMPSISPKKSWEGFIGSILLCSLACVLAWWFLYIPVSMAIVLTFLTPVIATLGDFCESLLKRDLGIKDMGNLLPGHGGVMDRLDSLLVFAPVAYMIFRFLLRF